MTRLGAALGGYSLGVRNGVVFAKICPRIAVVDRFNLRRLPDNPIL